MPLQKSRTQYNSSILYREIVVLKGRRSETCESLKVRKVDPCDLHVTSAAFRVHSSDVIIRHTIEIRTITEHDFEHRLGLLSSAYRPLLLISGCLSLLVNDAAQCAAGSGLGRRR